MKRIVVAAVAALGIFGVAQAADMPVKGPFYKAAPPVFNWTGFYVGGTLGYGWGETRWTNVVGATTGNFDTDGVIGGFTLGRNWQAPGSTWVYGIEADISGAQIRGSTNTNCGPDPCVSTLEMLATFRGRIGYAKGSTLFYATGGLAVGLVDYFGTGAVNDDTVELGWTAGAGIESVWRRNWSWKVEYLYVDLGRSDVFFVPAGLAAPINRMHIARLGVNYRW